MQFHKTAQVVRIGGRLALSDAQAKVRAGRLAPAKDDKDKPIKGLYVLGEPLDFKAGELIGFEGDAPKGLLRMLVGGDSGGELTHFDASGKEVEAPKKVAKKPAAATPGGDSGGEPK